MVHEVMVERSNYEEMFTKEICECILNSCLDKCENIVERGIIKELQIKAIKLTCEEKNTFIKMKSSEDRHVWYRWRRGAKTRYIKKINESMTNKTLEWMHIAYIKFVRMVGTDLRVPIVVGKSNTSSSFDLVYTTKVIKGKENSKSWIRENLDWEWDVENLVVFLPNVRISEGRDILEKQKIVLYRKIAYEIEGYLSKILSEENVGIGPQKVFSS